MTARGWEALVAEASQNGTSSLAAVWADGRVETWSADEDVPRESMSVTKFVVGAVLGTCLPVSDLNQPVSRWITEWGDDPRGQITLRHVMTHTTGLEVRAAADAYAAESIETLVLSLPAVADSGAFDYNNVSIHLLAMVVKRATGHSLDKVAAHRLFDPLGISAWHWQRDPQGLPLCMAGLSMRAVDLARVGALYLADTSGPVPPEWIEAMIPTPPGEVGLCCFADYAWIRRTEAGVEVGPRTGFGHTGDYGQWLTVQPAIGVAVVRFTDTRDREHMWDDFPGAIATAFDDG